LQLKARAEDHGVSLRQALSEAEGLPPQARAGARQLLELLEGYGRRFRTDGLTPEALREFFRDSGLKAQIEDSVDSPKAAKLRLELLEELAESASRGQRVEGKVDLGLFVETLSLDPPAGPEKGSEEAVTLMTLHSAKGLEFPVVFLVGMEEGLLPHVRNPAAARSFAEERRLCYVGMTRARERLILCHARARRRRGVSAVSVPSRFLAEIPLTLTERTEAAAQRDEEEEKTRAREFFRGVRELLS
jgi:superfamily I DNA/RNA helicase